jgi:hypothetical protein
VAKKKLESGLEVRDYKGLEGVKSEKYILALRTKEKVNIVALYDCSVP